MKNHLHLNLSLIEISIKYVTDNGICRLSASGSCLLDAAVDMMEKILKESYYLYNDDGEDEWYDG